MTRTIEEQCAWAHKEVNRIRRKSGLAPYPFVDNPTPVITKLTEVIHKEQEIEEEDMATSTLMAQEDTQEKKFYVSTKVCICGCNTLLPSTLAERGWNYLRGHKPKDPAKPKGNLYNASATNPHKMEEFFNTQIADWEKQIERLEPRHKQLSLELDNVRTAIDRLRDNIQRTKGLKAQVLNHFNSLRS